MCVKLAEHPPQSLWLEIQLEDYVYSTLIEFDAPIAFANVCALLENYKISACGSICNKCN